MVSTVHTNSTGTVFRMTLAEDGTPIDLTGHTTLELIFQKPDETVITRTATLVGLATAGLIQYVALDSEIDMVGSWCWQAHVIIPSGEWWSDAADFEVVDNLA